MSVLVRAAAGVVALLAVGLVAAIWTQWGPVPALVLGLLLALVGFRAAWELDQQQQARARRPVATPRFRNPEEG